MPIIIGNTPQPFVLNIREVKGSSIVPIKHGKPKPVSKLVQIMNGKRDGSAELYHNKRPFFADIIISLGNKIIITLKIATIIGIITICMYLYLLWLFNLSPHMCININIFSKNKFYVGGCICGE